MSPRLGKLRFGKGATRLTQKRAPMTDFEIELNLLLAATQRLAALKATTLLMLKHNIATSDLGSAKQRWQIWYNMKDEFDILKAKFLSKWDEE